MHKRGEPSAMVVGSAREVARKIVDASHNVGAPRLFLMFKVNSVLYSKRTSLSSVNDQLPFQLC
jgi:hypothetical protein